MIVRSPRPESHFTQIQNTVLRDERLSFRARGVLNYLLSMPDNWRSSSDALAEQSPTEGRDAIRSALTELEQLGYIERRKSRNGRGQIQSELIVYDEPQAQPAPGEPVSERPAETSETAGQASDGFAGAGKAGALRTLGSKNTQEKNTAVVDPEVVQIVGLLQARVEAHMGKAVKTNGWDREIDLLLRRGPTEWAQPEPIRSCEVVELIEDLFLRGTARGNDGFCWADQIRSGAALRRHWVKLVIWRQRTSTPAGQQRSSVVDEVLDAYTQNGVEPGQLFGVNAPRGGLSRTGVRT